MPVRAYALSQTAPDVIIDELFASPVRVCIGDEAFGSPVDSGAIAFHVRRPDGSGEYDLFVAIKDGRVVSVAGPDGLRTEGRGRAEK